MSLNRGGFLFRHIGFAIGWLLIVSTLLHPSLVWSGPEENGSAEENPGFEVKSSDLSQVQLQALLESAHRVVEGEDPNASKFRQYLEGLNLKRRLINAVRWYNVHRGRNETHAFNMVFMLGVSHGTETLSGPAYFIWGLANGIPAETLLPTTGALLSLAIPGLDWICIVLAGTYVSSEDFRQFITNARLYTVKATKKTGQFLGVTPFLQALIKTEPADTSLARTLKPYIGDNRVSIDPKKRHEFILKDSKGDFLTRLEFSDSGFDRLALETASFGQVPSDAGSADVKRKELDELLRHFRWNVRDAVLSVYDQIAKKTFSKLAKSAFIQSVERIEPAQVRVRFEPSAIQIRTSRSYHFREALEAVPGIANQVRADLGDALFATPSALWWLTRNSPRISYRIIIGTPWVAYKTLKIGYSLVATTLGTAVEIGKKLGHAVFTCAQWLGEGYRSNPPMHP